MDNEETTAQRLVTPAQNEETSSEQPATATPDSKGASQQAQTSQPGDEIALSLAPMTAQSGDDSTQQAPAKPEGDSDATIQVPVVNPAQAMQDESIPAASGPKSVPFMDIDDLLTLKIASDPQISPDRRFRVDRLRRTIQWFERCL